MSQFENVEFTEDFKLNVRNLPDKFDIKEEDNRRKFELFFQKWGHVVITQAFGGGSIEIKISSDSISSECMGKTFQAASTNT